MGVDIVLAVGIAFAVCAALGPFLIPFLRKVKAGQTEREELESHQVKAGTPTMGGLMILAGITVSALAFAGRYPKIIPVLILTLGFGIIGFLDDYLKVVLKRSDGLLPWQKMILQIIVTGIFAFYIIRFSNISLTMLIPFTNGFYLDIGWLSVPLLFIAVIATVNGTNFTDGVDGLASCVTVVVAAFLTFASVMLKGGVEPMCAAVAGALMGFLVYNAYPAKIFMGDTGSLALGGFVAGVAYVLQMPWFILIFGLIYAVELLSVAIQVTYFKATHGKRVFRMAPIHHHYELGGWSETKVVTVFTIVTILMCLVAYLGMPIY